MTADLGALVQERLTDTVYGLIRERILSGAFAPGEKLNVDQLAEQLNISPTPVKGALALLAVEGLVQIQPRRGTFVASISEDDLSEVLAGLDRGAADWAVTASTAYAQRRAGDLARTGTIVDTLFRSLLADMLPAQALRAGGLWALKLLPPLRRQAFALGMGAR